MNTIRTYALVFTALMMMVGVCLGAGTDDAPAATAAPATSTAPAGMAPAPDFPTTYKGTPFVDEKYKDGAQKIPGKMMCAYYDLGGEGVAFHINDKKNHGSGQLNPLNGQYKNEFRHTEAISISYTKDFADKWEGQKFFPPMDMFYVGWTQAGQWTNYTVDVAEDGTYTVDLAYTSNMGGVVSLDVNGKPLEKKIDIETTNDPKDTTAWRQWHHWNLAKDIVEVKLARGRNLITFHVVEKGNMNLGYLDFQKKK